MSHTQEIKQIDGALQVARARRLDAPTVKEARVAVRRLNGLLDQRLEAMRKRDKPHAVQA